ncbi:hypothetical protein BLOT_012403 [Blomia tropicalis]|nr:hypothetical protein BLOT_012403 [Blomia tropicalis]
MNGIYYVMNSNVSGELSSPRDYNVSWIEQWLYTTCIHLIDNILFTYIVKHAPFSEIAFKWFN